MFNSKLLRLGISFLIFAAIVTVAGFWLSRPALAGWWPDGGTAWLNRKQLTLTNNSGGNLNTNAVVTVTLDTQSLYTLGKLKSDCSDLRIIYNPNSTTYKDLNRYVGFPSGTTCSISTSSKVSFALQAAVNNAASSTDYYLYYNNPDASVPTNDRTAFSIGSANATFVCSFDNTTTCLAAGTATPTLTSGTARYSGSKSAMSFDGANDYVTTGNIGSDIKTVEFWIYPTSTTNYFVDLNGSAYISASAGTVSATGFTSPTIYVNGVVSTTITANSWQHIAVTTTTAINASSTNIGKIASTYLAGYIDELRISNSVRYSAAFTTTTTPFIRDSNTKLIYHFDENGDDPRQTGKTIDDSGNGNHGTISGAKYVAGLVGVDASTSNTGNVPRQSYASHEGVMLEEATTNKITNPSFENATYDTNWTGAASGTLTLQPDPTAGIDNMVAEGGQADNNYGTNTLLYNQNNAGTQTYNPIKFDLTSIPAGSTITSATLTLWTYTTSGTGNLNVYRILAANSAWTESGSTWNYAVASSTRWAGDTGSDGGSDAGGSVSGTDHSSTLMGSVALTNGEAANTQKDITLDTTEFASMFANNYGLIAKKDSGGYGIFYASDYTTDTTKRPKLVVNYNASFTLTQNTTAPYYKFGSNSAKVVAGADGTLTTSINPGNTNTHMLSAYVYDGTSGNVGGTVGATVAKLVYRGTAQTTTYTDMGGGWWRLSYSAAAANAAENYGVQVLSGKTVYIDGVQLEALAYATTYADGSLGTGYAWTGTANNSTSTRAKGDLRYSSTNNISSTGGTVNFWVYPNYAWNTVMGASTTRYLYSVNSTCGSTIGNSLHIRWTDPFNGDGRRLNTALTESDSSDSTLGPVSVTGTGWKMITITYRALNDGADFFTLYVNGASQSTATGRSYSMDLSAKTVTLGGDSAGACTGNSNFSNLQSWSSALSANDVSDLYYSGLVGHSENIVIDRFGGGDTKGQDPLATWHMDEGYGTTVNDSSRNAKPLTASGATWESGIGNTRSARARFLKFDGSTSYLSRAQDSGFDFGTGSFSVSGWFHHTSTAPASGTHTILARYGSAGFKVYMNTSGYVCFGIDADSTWSPADTACSGASDGSLADSKWHHLEAVKNGTTSISLYIDGHLAQTTSVTATGSMNTSSTMYLGVDSTGNSNYWNGWLDEFMVYPYARSAAQVKTDLLDPVAVLIGSSANDPLSNGLVGYWKMDEASWNGTAGEVIDASGNGSNGQAVGGATTTAGKFGNGGSLGTSKMVKTTVTAARTNVITVTAWIKPTNNLTSRQDFLASGNTCCYSTNNWIFSVKGNYGVDGGLSILGYSPSESSDLSTDASVLTLNTWTHVVFTSDGSDQKIYVNGEVVKTGSITINANNTLGEFIGASSSDGTNPNGPLIGLMDEARIYNRALTPKEVRDLYAWAPGPVGYWNMDEGTGATANDISGNGATGTATGTTIVPGKFGKARQFTASDNVSATIVDPAYFNTVETWIYPTTSVASKTIITTSKLTTDSSSRPVYGACTGTALSLNQWTHITAVSTDSTHCYLYQNGVQTATGGTGVTFGTAVGIGQTSFLGKLDDVKIYNYARTQKQVVEDMLGSPKLVSGGGSGGAVGHWKFDEGADNTCSGGANDACNSGSAGSALDGAQSGMATPATATSGWTNSGKFGKALVFDGSNDYVSVTSTSSLQPTTAVTLSAWIKPTSGFTSNYRGIIYGDGNGNSYVLVTNITNGLLRTWFAGTAVNSTTAISADAWTHVLATYDGVNIKLYINGVLDKTQAKTGSMSGFASTLYIGAADATTYPFLGSIDEPKVYNYALTQDEIKIDYNRGSTLVMGSLGDNSSYQKQAANQEYCVPGDSTSCVTPLAEWKFDEGTSTTAFDSTGNGVKGTLVNSPAWIAGKFGKALNFNGSNSYVTTTHQDALFNTITTAMTISGWFKPSAGSLSSRRDLIQRAGSVGSINGASAAKDIWWFNLQNSGKMNFYMGGITGAYVETTTAISAGVWSYLTVTYDGSNIRFYINGKLDKTSAASGTVQTGDNGVGIGGNLSGVSPATVFSGGIDALRVWGYARSPAQVAYDYNRGGPMAQYKFDECQGGVAYDSADPATGGIRNNGTITIGASGTQTSTGTCGTSTTTEAWNNGTTGKRNASINLDGNDDYVTTAAFSPLATAAVTTTKASWGGWFYPTSSAASLTLMEKATEFRLTTDANSKPVCGIYYSAAFTDATAGSTALTTSSWNHVLCTYDGANIKTYLNGSLVGTTAETNDITAASSILYMGENSSSAQFVTGQIDDVRVYNYALTASQIKTLINEGAVRFGPQTGSP